MSSSLDPIVVTGLAYEAHARDYAKARSDRSRVQPAVQRFAELLRPSARVLDSGCGPGVDTASLARAGLRPVGLDLAAAMAVLAQAHAPGAVLQGDSRHLPFQTGTFEGVWANLSLLHLPKNQVSIALREIVRATQSNGVFFAGLQAGSDDGIELGRPGSSMSAPRFYARYELDEWVGYIEEAGFEIVEAETSGSMLRTFARKP